MHDGQDLRHPLRRNVCYAIWDQITFMTNKMKKEKKMYQNGDIFLFIGQHWAWISEAYMLLPLFCMDIRPSKLCDYYFHATGVQLLCDHSSGSPNCTWRKQNTCYWPFVWQHTVHATHSLRARFLRQDISRVTIQQCETKMNFTVKT